MFLGFVDAVRNDGIVIAEITKKRLKNLQLKNRCQLLIYPQKGTLNDCIENVIHQGMDSVFWQKQQKGVLKSLRALVIRVHECQQRGCFKPHHSPQDEDFHVIKKK